MQNKKSVMAFAALLIVIFHFWVSECEDAMYFIAKTAYIGVDIFFLVSTYSLARREIKDYKAFVISRFKAIYPKFFILSVVAFLLGRLGLGEMLLTITFAELFIKGGGAFLWFLPAIMIMYLFFPLYQRQDRANPKRTLLVATIGYILTALFFTYLIPYKQIFIFLNRVPIMLLGYYMGRVDILGGVLKNRLIRVIAGVGLTTVGYLLIYRFAYIRRLQFPFRDTFFIVVIATVIGLVLLLSVVPELRIVKWIGSSTLEIYGIQTFIGLPILQYLYYASGYDRVLANVLTLICIVAVSVVAHYLYESLVRCICVGGRDR